MSEKDARDICEMKPARYRKRPVEIEAIQLVRYSEAMAFSKAQAAIVNAFMGPDAAFTIWSNETVTIRTPEGDMKASVGDWIIKGVKGEFYPCKPDIFAMTYEPVA